VRFRAVIGASSAILLTFGLAQRTRAQAEEPAAAIDLVVEAGRPLQVALDQRVSVKRIGQPVTGTLVDPVYGYDRILVPAGTKVLGHVAKLEGASRAIRARAILGGDLTPIRHAVLEFDTLVLDDGRQIPVKTVVSGAIPNPKRSVAATSEAKRTGGSVGRAGEEVKAQARDAVSAAKQKASDALSAVTQPGRMERLKEAAIQRLPYHPTYLAKGTVYHAGLVSPLEFGATAPVAAAPAGTLPAPESVLNARLATTLESSKTPRGTPIEAIVTEPVFSSDHRLILPEGTTLRGEVTLAKQARRFHRNGQLRFLFESVQPPRQDASKLLASLYSVRASGDDHVVVDEEGGTTLDNSKTRFIAPALAVLALRATADHGHHPDGDGDANDLPGATVQSGGGFGSRGVGGFLGLGLLGVGLSQISRPVGVTLAVVGVVRTFYTNVLGKGKEVSFPADTSIQLQLAPGPTARY
jgi:hypothetical protein